MTSDTNVSPPKILPPPLIFLGMLGLGFLLDYMFPLKIFRLPWGLRIFCSVILFVISGYLALGSIIVLHRNKTPFDPSRPTVKIVCQGPYRLSRNPMYLALVLLLAVAAVFTGSLWMCLAVPALLIVLDITAVRPEQEYLENNFGGRYLAYRAKVRRWL